MCLDKTHLQEEAALHPDHLPENAAMDAMRKTQLQDSFQRQDTKRKQHEDAPAGRTIKGRERRRRKREGRDRTRSRDGDGDSRREPSIRMPIVRRAKVEGEEVSLRCREGNRKRPKSFDTPRETRAWRALDDASQRSKSGEPPPPIIRETREHARPLQHEDRGD